MTLSSERETTEIGKRRVGVTPHTITTQTETGVVPEKQEWENMDEGPG